ncbi:MAG: hypothetical protein FJ118_20125 [Deltaproteobacteria bacterium]|nr:hypothetical protein [Deltaproteobacteria bacterium]
MQTIDSRRSDQRTGLSEIQDPTSLLAPVPFVRLMLCVLLMVLSLWPGVSGPVYPGGPSLQPSCPPSFCYGMSEKRSMAEGRFGYFWGWHEIRLREGDNALIPPSKKEVTLSSLIFSAQAETFPMKDLAVRVQGWLNIPQTHRNEVWFDRRWAAWDTRSRYLGADLSAVYHFGMGGMPYTAGLVAGYRFYDFDYTSQAVSAPAGDFQDHLSAHIPYVGVYYAHSQFIGSVVRLDLLAAPITLARYRSDRSVSNSMFHIDGHAVTGFWFESLFEWLLPLTDNALAGVIAQYNYLELSGGATVEADGRSTRFSMDSRHNVIVLGLSATYTF